MFLSLPHFYKIINSLSNEIQFDVYTYNVASYSLIIIANINVGIILLVLLSIIGLRKPFKNIVALLIIITCFYLTLIPLLECSAEKAVSKIFYDVAINRYNKLLNIIKIYPLIKNEKELVYKVWKKTMLCILLKRIN